MALVVDVIGTAVIAAALGTGFWLARPSLRGAAWWQATVTPLASIIGSGFLVVTPLLAGTVGHWAPLAMLGIVVVAYWVGSTMRFVIAEVEPRLEGGHASRAFVDLDRLSRLVLALAYVVSVAFYLRLMASFVLRPFGESEVVAQVMTTVVLVAIGAVGWTRGLHGLEILEEFAVSVKLAVIAGLLVGLAILDVSDPGAVVDAYSGSGIRDDAWTTIRVLAGMLLVVQGFETSRFLGGRYDRRTRISSMRRAQLIAGVVYVVFVALSVRVFDALPGTVDDTAVLDVAGEVTVVLIPMLIVAAIASQLSAAVADTVGGGEMLAAGNGTATSGVGYVAITGAAVAVVWLADVFAIISIASRAFAAYYLTQTLLAVMEVVSQESTSRRTVQLAQQVLLAAVLAFVVLFAIPAD